MEKINEIIRTNTDLNQVQKNVLLGFIARAAQSEAERRQDRELVEEFGRVKNKLFEVVLSTPDVKIYTVSGKDEWDIKYPYRIIFLDMDGNWSRCNQVCPNLDTAFLTYLQDKHLGANSQFADFASKMLEINLD